MRIFEIGDVVVHKAALESAKIDWEAAAVVSKRLGETVRQRDMRELEPVPMPKMPPAAGVTEVITQRCHGGTQTFYMLSSGEGERGKEPAEALAFLSAARDEAFRIMELE